MADPETTEREVEELGGKGNFLTKFLTETKVELKKVTWPTKQEIIANTIVVLIAVVLCAGLIWIIDSMFSILFRLLLR